MFERELRQLSFVPRWVITRDIRTQSVAEHSFYVAVYAEQIAGWLGHTGPIGQLLKYALWHDVDECVTGDIPGPAKRNMVPLSREKNHTWLFGEMCKRFPGGEWKYTPTRQEKDIVKLADLLDALFFKATEIQLGNRNAEYNYKEVMGWIRDHIRRMEGLSEGTAGLELMKGIVHAGESHMLYNDYLPRDPGHVGVQDPTA